MTSMQDFFNEPSPANVVKYIAVWRAGYEGERDLESFSNYWDAIDWIGENYTDEEIEADHIAVCTLLTNGERTYEN